MSFKFGSRYRGAFLCMFCVGLVQFFLARAVADDATQELVLASVGNGKTSLGHDISFRLYKASDGTTGRWSSRHSVPSMPHRGRLRSG
jgi:hypothetical protein